MAVKDRSGPRPAAQSAKRHLLKRLETSSKPWLCLLFRIANCQNTMAVKDGSGPRPAGQSAKRHLLKWLETSSKPWLCLPFSTANCQLARVLLQLAFVLHSSGLKHHGNEGQIGPGQQPRVPNITFWRKWLETLPALLHCQLSCSWLSPCTVPVKKDLPQG